jgi:hypothetical protein
MAIVASASWLAMRSVDAPLPHKPDDWLQSISSTGLNNRALAALAQAQASLLVVGLAAAALLLVAFLVAPVPAVVLS